MIRFLFAVALFLGLGIAPTFAETAPQPKLQITIDKRKLLVPPKNADGSIEVTPFLEDPVLWVRDKQQEFYGAMSGALHAVGERNPLAALWTLVGLSFAYGILHAAGPGHGKVVISSWLLATENELRRGIAIAAMSALVQALVAIVIISGLLIVVASAGAAARTVAGTLESVSYAMITGLGLWLVWTAARPFLQRHSAGAIAPVYTFESITPLAPDHVHGPDCGHTHLPVAADVRGEWSLKRAISLAVAVGIRPCTGALLVLLLANSLGLYWAGIAATFAMALGTFITVAGIATLAVYSRALAMRLAAGRSAWPGRLAVLLRFGGGALVAGLGTLLFLASLASHTPVQ